MNLTKQWITSLSLLLLGVVVSGCASVEKPELPAHVPAGYALVYSQDFESADAMDDFRFTNASAWQRTESGDGNAYLDLFGKSAYQPIHRSPRKIGLIRTGTVGSFVLDVDMQQSGREYGHRDLCIFFGFNDPEHFYYTHMATVGDRNAHHVFIVNDNPRTPITTQRTKGVDWGTDVWRHIRVVRNAKAGTISVYFDDMENPIQVATDITFTEGYIGFGSFDDTGRIDNIQLYAPAMSESPCDHFENQAKR